MKQKFNYLVIVVASALMMGTSCSNDDNNSSAPEGTKEVTVKINKGKITAKAIGESAKDIIPTVKDLTLYFADPTEAIVSVQSFPIGLSSSGEIKDSDEKTFTVPNSAITVYAVGNTNAIPESIILPNVILGSTTMDDIQSSLIDINKQTDPKNALNVKSDITVLQAPGAGGQIYTANIALKSAVARIEIQEVKSDANVNIPLTGFKLAGIYINNTYTKFGLDQETAGSEVNYGKSDQDIPVWAHGGSFPDFLKDEPVRAGESLGIAGTGVSYLPGTQSSDVWGYFLPATIENNAVAPFDPSKPGTTIDNVKYGAVPHIILKIEDATANNGTIPSIQYVTIRSFSNTSGESITKLEAGNYYLIKSINIGGEHLASRPEDMTKKIDVTVTVLKWNEVEIVPNI